MFGWKDVQSYCAIFLSLGLIVTDVVKNDILMEDLALEKKSKSKSKKTLFKVGQCKQYNISSHLKWVLVADKSMHISKVQ